MLAEICELFYLKILILIDNNFYKYYRVYFPVKVSNSTLVTVQFSENFVAPYPVTAYKASAD